MKSPIFWLRFERRVRHGCALLTCVALAGCAPAPDVATALPTTAPARLDASLAGTEFGRRISAAVTGHPALALEVARITAAQGQLAAARGRFRPRVAVGVDATLGLAGTSDGQTSGVPVVTVSQLLFDAGASRAQIAAARSGLDQRLTDRRASAAQLTLAAVQAWADLHRQRALQDLAQANLRVHQDFLAQVRARLDAGAGTEGDFLAAQSRLAGASARAVAVQSGVERAEAVWREIFSAPPPAVLAPVPTAPALPALGDPDLVAVSPRILALDAQLAAATANAEAVRAARWPSLSLDLVGQRDLDAGTNAAEAQLRPRFDLDTAGQRSAAVVQAVAEVDSLRARRDEAARQIQRALEVLRSDSRTGRARLATAREALAANEAAVTAARAQFGIGRSSISALLDAQRDVFDAGQALIAAEHDLALSGYTALALTGDILDVFGVILPQVLEAS